MASVCCSSASLRVLGYAGNAELRRILLRRPVFMSARNDRYLLLLSQHCVVALLVAGLRHPQTLQSYQSQTLCFPGAAAMVLCRKQESVQMPNCLWRVLGLVCAICSYLKQLGNPNACPKCKFETSVLAACRA